MRILIVLIFSLQSVFSYAQSDLTTVVKKDLMIGNISDLASHFTDNIDISINDTDAIYSKSQAAMVLKKFFKGNEVTDFKTEHAGNATENNRYIIGKMATENGSYRVTYFITTIDGKHKIKQFNIESY